MRSALTSVPGVDSVNVDFDDKTARVTCNGACDREALVAALDKAGYGATVK